MEVLSPGGNVSTEAAHKRAASLYSVFPFPKQGVPVHWEKALPCQPVQTAADLGQKFRSWDTAMTVPP